MHGLVNIDLSSLATIQNMVKPYERTPEFREFLEKAKEAYNRDSEFKAEIDRVVGESDQDLVPTEQDVNHPALDGLSDSEKEIVLASMRRAGDSTVQLSGESRESRTNTKLVVGVVLVAAAIVAIFVFRGVVFRTLYFLAVKLPLVGPLLQRKYGEPKDILSGQLSESALKRIAQDVSELERLSGLRGKFGNNYKLVRFLELIRNVSIPDVKAFYEDAEIFKSYRQIR